MKLLPVRLALAAFAACPVIAAHALPPDQIVERAAPGTWALRALDANNQLYNQGSAVAIGAGKAVTSCSLLLRAAKIELRREQATLPATLEFPDAERDLCQLDVPGLPGTELARAAPRLGQRVYAIGYERGVDLAIAEGLYSRARDAGSDAERIQTSVPGSAGLLGAGLYDEEARLLGIVTASPADAAAMLFALPSKWLAELPERGRAALAARAAAPLQRTGGLPAAGMAWTYRYRDLRFSNTQDFSLQVAAVNGQSVEEIVSAAGTAPGAGQRSSANAGEMRFHSRRLRAERYALEFNPYLLAKLAGEEPIIIVADKSDYPGSEQRPWIVTARQMGWEEVTVPAGTFKAMRIDLSGGRRNPPGTFIAWVNRFEYRIWYVPEVRRHVLVQHQSWQNNGTLYASDTIELVSRKTD